MWLAEFLFGLFLGYYCMSPRLRRFTNGLIAKGIGLFRIQHPRNKWVDMTWRNVPLGKSKPLVAKKATLKTQPVELWTDKSQVVVEGGKVKEWLESNADLRRANGG